MALKITARKATEVPRPTSVGKVNEDLEALKAQMASLGPRMVLEIEPDRRRSLRGVKAMVTRAARELGVSWRHWHAGNKVFAQPTRRRRGRRRRTTGKAA